MSLLCVIWLFSIPSLAPTAAAASSRVLTGRIVSSRPIVVRVRGALVVGRDALLEAPAVLLSATSLRVDGRLIARSGGRIRVAADRLELGSRARLEAPAGAIELAGASFLALRAESRVDASGSEDQNGGTVEIRSGGSGRLEPGTKIDVSGGAQAGDAGSLEVLVAGSLELAGDFRGDAAPGFERGRFRFDPTVLTINGSTSLIGAGSIAFEADQRIAVAPSTTIDLADPSQAGDGSTSRQSLTLRSGGDITFGQGAGFVDDGSGGGGQKIWDVSLVAGADLASPNLLALAPGSHGSIYLSGATFDGTGAVTSLGSSNGEVALTHGDLTVRAAGGLVIGNGGGLKDETGEIDVAIGGDVTFRARRDVDAMGHPIEGVIENGSGDISIVAGDSIALAENPNTSGNAAIRTRGVIGTDLLAQTTVGDGGSIFIEVGGDVDAGVGNRWLEPGPPFTPADYADLVSQLPPDAGPPPGYVPPTFDPLPVGSDGVLGIGTEAGGDVTIVAGGSVRTGASSLARSGATAAGLGTQYNGSHIGVFGVPVVQAIDYLTGVVRNVVIDGAPQNHLTVVAGDAIEGDFAVRNGEAEMRAGYALANGVSARTLDPAHLDASLVESGAVQADATHGWVGTLARPVTVDLIGASLDGAGRNGVAIRAIENPSLVYPPATLGTSAVPSWEGTDLANLRSSHGDVILVGDEISLPSLASQTLQPNPLVRVMPPNVSIATDRGDLVLLNDFLIYPSDRGGLDLQIAGQVRTANFSASSAAVLALTVETFGPTGGLAFMLPAGTRFREPNSGIEFVLQGNMALSPRPPGADPSVPGNGHAVACGLVGCAPIVTAAVLGPAGEQAPGTALVLEDGATLPPGASAADFSIAVNQLVAPAAVTPALFRALALGQAGKLRPDPEPGTVATVSPADTWIRDGAGASARIGQSDAAPDVDGRSLNGSFDYFGYLSLCHAGSACAQGLFGAGPTHATDPTPSVLRALGGFERVAIQLAKPAFALTGDAGRDGVFGTADDGASGSVVDLALITQHARASDETLLWVPIGDASFGAESPAPGLPPDLGAGLEVAGPGSARLLVGVLPNAPQRDTNENGSIDPEESAGDRNGDGAVELSEWLGSPAVFSEIDQADRLYNLTPFGPPFARRPEFDASPKPLGDGSIAPEETPYVPSGRGGAIRLSMAAAPSPQLPAALFARGIRTIGNVSDPILPLPGASLFVAADGAIDLGTTGSIATYQGGRLVVESVSGAVREEEPPEGSAATRGVVTMFRSAGFGSLEVDPAGGGDIGVDVRGGYDVDGGALAAFSGGDISVFSRSGPIHAGVAKPFSTPLVFVDASGEVMGSFDGSGIAALDGTIELVPEPQALALGTLAAAALAVMRARRSRTGALRAGALLQANEGPPHGRPANLHPPH